MVDNKAFDNQFDQLKQISDGCTHFQVELIDPRRFVITFSVKSVEGIEGSSAGDNSVEPRFTEEQKIELSVNDQFPISEPEIAWKSPIYHPNVPADGHLRLTDIGLSWEPSMDLAIVCERLWDVARMAYLEKVDAANSTAGNWIVKNSKLELPLSEIRFGCPTVESSVNIFRYQRKTGQRIPPRIKNSEERLANINDDDQEIIFIGD